jgi:hypothetical protein
MLENEVAVTRRRFLCRAAATACGCAAGLAMGCSTPGGGENLDVSADSARQSAVELPIACCGLNCGHCPLYTATQNRDLELKREIAEQWTKNSGEVFRPEDISCGGCQGVTGILARSAATCPIRPCARKRAVANCAHCSEYACDKLKTFQEHAPDAKNTLEMIRQQI